MEEFEKDVVQRLTALESSYKSLHKRIDRWESIAESIQEIAVEIRHLREDVNVVTNKVDIIESAPKKNWQALITGIISALTSGVIGFLVAHFLGG